MRRILVCATNTSWSVVQQYYYYCSATPTVPCICYMLPYLPCRINLQVEVFPKMQDTLKIPESRPAVVSRHF